MYVKSNPLAKPQPNFHMLLGGENQNSLALKHYGAVIIDWGRTLHDPELDSLMPGALRTVKTLSRFYRIGVVSLAGSEPAEQRRLKIERSGLSPFLQAIRVGPVEKGTLFAALCRALKVRPSECIVVDDRVSRGVRWGKQHGAKTVWSRSGKFAFELPRDHNEEPDFIVTAIEQLVPLLVVDHLDREGDFCGKSHQTDSDSVAI